MSGKRSDSDCVEHLVNVLHDRDIDLGQDDVLWAFEALNTRNDARAWVEEYLDEPTLLTKDELKFIQSVPNEPLSAHEAELQPLKDHELAKAISALQSSTSAIEGQLKLLEKQKKALASLKRNRSLQESGNGPSRRGHTARTQELGRLNIQIEELLYTTSDALQFATSQASTTRSSTTSTTTSTLASDDRALSRVEKIFEALEKAEGDTSAEDTKRVELWCSSLVKFRSATIKSRVNAVRHSKDPNLEDTSTSDLNAEKAALEEELKSLNEEIDSVAEMVVDQDFRQPLTRLLLLVGDKKAEEMASWGNYFTSTMAHITKRLSMLQEQAEDLSAYERSLQEIDATFKEESEADKAKTPSELNSPQIPLLAPALTVPDDLAALLQHFSIPQKALASGSQKAISDRTVQLNFQQASVHLELWKTLAGSTSRDEADLDALLERVYAYTDYATVKLGDPALENRLDQLDKDIAELGASMKTIEKGESEAERRAKDNFLKKWG